MRDIGVGFVRWGRRVALTDGAAVALLEEAVDLLRHGVADADLTADDAFGLLTAMHDAGRGLRTVARAQDLTR